MSDIPSELFHNILRRVPAESLLRFRAVCKEWRRLIDDPSFIRSHTNNQDSLNYNDADAHQMIDVIPVKTLYRAGVPRTPTLPVASCNGLILLSNFDIKKTWVIWNPLTRRFHELPKFLDTNSRLVCSGLGYDCASDDYKVMRVDELLRPENTVYQTCVYSLKSDNWRIVKDCRCHYYSTRPGVFVNGALHWSSWHIITAFVFRTENYELLRLPFPTGQTEPSKMHLDALGGCLVVSYYYTRDRMDVWVMKDYGDDESWVKLCSFGELGSIGASWNLRPIAYFKSKGHVFLQNGDEFFWLDCESNAAKKVIINGLPNDFSCQSFPGSLFRLDQTSKLCCCSEK